ncbi:hypothetical protein EDC48_1126 [Gibbsiella quercinecans]|nr:hypothetical protein EDC48_1126 [Gibbsiella quercinecans]
MTSLARITQPTPKPAPNAIGLCKHADDKTRPGKKRRQGMNNACPIGKNIVTDRVTFSCPSSVYRHGSRQQERKKPINIKTIKSPTSTTRGHASFHVLTRYLPAGALIARHVRLMVKQRQKIISSQGHDAAPLTTTARCISRASDIWNLIHTQHNPVLPDPLSVPTSQR